ncbi:mannitol dehydrogenase family protein [Aestuariivirga litoralis]|uniref:mannitol dehydrogenase family protein n=1 Tax=Aestuariivirga litoralis TaxID=2650924 RepID=UPI0018C73376|nr:mannitol dehydrogenase family protein [Aestuariivirga litoralis]MBG1232539.1 mannitol dehydrogenase family protein [Aestuariivirga litoralis]
MTNLSLANLPEIGKKMRIPTYKREGLKPGILHFGVGNFHRAHLAVYLDDLFNKGHDHDWALIGTGVMEFDEKLRQTLASQDFLTTVVEQDNDLSTAHITGPLIDFIPPANKQAILEKLADPAIRIVSMTITEGGYFIDPATQKFDPKHPAIAKDAANPNDPATVFGFIVAGLKLRKAKGIPAFTVMSCDNVPHNGVVTKNAVVGLAKLSDSTFADWITANVAFPNGMVDRITPATGDRERKICAETFGVEDKWPIFCEEFKQWVVEDNFPLGRPAWEKVGAEFVKDVTPWEYMKIRILNGGHAVIAYISGLLDIHFVHDAMANPLVRDYLKKVTDDEIRPTVGPVPGTDLKDYQKLIERRFSNPKIADTVRRLCFDGSNRQPKFIVPPIADRLKAGKSINGLALESALWCRYCYGTSDSGKVIEANDPSWAALQPTAQKAKDNPQAWLDMADIYGEVGQHPEMKKLFAHYLNEVWKNGAEKTVKAYLAS